MFGETFDEQDHNQSTSHCIYYLQECWMASNHDEQYLHSTCQGQIAYPLAYRANHKASDRQYSSHAYHTNQEFSCNFSILSTNPILHIPTALFMKI